MVHMTTIQESRFVEVNTIPHKKHGQDTFSLHDGFTHAQICEKKYAITLRETKLYAFVKEDKILFTTNLTRDLFATQD